ncbi:hypothetical protein H6P81_005425 [Aristolochia fimbriata]|uniref:Uncharacterized protein n=1 Tax=Aristolochia fimbriata TaxID=158543 RepID=A0AAV7EY48_ARIFI|nr:hypothetical protein H6P81_005425 [Aristolochia fimbriata]
MRGAGREWIEAGFWTVGNGPGDSFSFVKCLKFIARSTLRDSNGTTWEYSSGAHSAPCKITWNQVLSFLRSSIFNLQSFSLSFFSPKMEQSGIGTAAYSQSEPPPISLIGHRRPTKFPNHPCAWGTSKRQYFHLFVATRNGEGLVQKYRK